VADVRKVLDDGLYAGLQAAAALRDYGIWNTMPPPYEESPRDRNGRMRPFIVFQQTDERMESTFGSRTFASEYMVKAVSQSRWPKEAATISSLIDTAMEDISLTVSGFTHLWAVRLRGFSLPVEVVDGLPFTSIGGIWWIQEGA
tara:strand:+ start:152 stop:583 length:432 start_codon:yes stop_codon:yes gene_type:complete